MKKQIENKLSYFHQSLIKSGDKLLLIATLTILILLIKILPYFNVVFTLPLVVFIVSLLTILLLKPSGKVLILLSIPLLFGGAFFVIFENIAVAESLANAAFGLLVLGFLIEATRMTKGGD